MSLKTQQARTPSQVRALPTLNDPAHMFDFITYSLNSYYLPNKVEFDNLSVSQIFININNIRFIGQNFVLNRTDDGTLEISMPLSPSSVGAEPTFGNPPTGGYVLTSSPTGTREWIPQTGGGDVRGNLTAQTGNFASFDQGSGRLITDSGSKSSDFATSQHIHSYTHTQNVSSSSWMVTHNLNRIPTVSVKESSSDEIIFCTVRYPTNNTAIIEFSAPIIGEAYFI
jgi:hypothetical protein